MSTFRQKVMVEKAKAVAQIDKVRRSVVQSFDKLILSPLLPPKSTVKTTTSAKTSTKTNWPGIISKMPRQFNIARAAKEAHKSRREVSTMLGRLVKTRKIKRIGVGSFSRIH